MNTMPLPDDILLKSCAEGMRFAFSGDQQLYVVDDATIYFEFYLKALQIADINYRCLAPQELVGLEDVNAFLLLPLFKFRIFNLNYDFQKGFELAPPYWVHISSDRVESLRKVLCRRFGKVFVHPLLDLTGLLETYLKSQSFLEWIQANSCPEHHNDRIDREILKKVLKNSGQRIDDVYKKDFLLKDESVEDFLCRHFKVPEASSYTHAPLHRLYQKRLNVDLPINLLEREIYGNVD